MRNFVLIILFNFNISLAIYSQSAPAIDENIPYLVTFGANSSTTWGDDDFCQVFYCVVPLSQTAPIYIRVYDPDTGGDLDELKAKFNTITSYSVYGGKGCWSSSQTRGGQAKESNKSGYLLSTKSFGVDPKYNKKWYSFGPFNPTEGEYAQILGGRIFKIVAQGISGDDGNLYKYFLSSSPTENIPIEGGNLFTYKYHFRLSDDQKHVSQIYPYVDDKTISIEVSNFDWDNDGVIRIFSNSKNGVFCSISGQNNWISKKFPIVDKEKNSTVEIQFIKNKSVKILSNNVVVTVKNQYGISLPFFVVPIGGIPVYSPKIRMK
jgi:hypothetical protein